MRGFILALVLVMFSVPLGASSELVVFWPIDDGKVDPVSNIVGEEGQGKLRGKVDLDEGVRGRALDFYDQDGFYSLDLLDSWVLSEAGFSVGFWLYHRGIDANTLLIQASGFKLLGDPVYKNRVVLELFFADGDKEVIRFPIDIPEREWVHLCIVVGKGRVDFYLNGKLAFSETYWNNKLRGDDNPVRERVFIAGDGNKNTFSGKIDELAWFPRRITEYECAGLI